MSPLIQLSHVAVAFQTHVGVHRALRDIDLDVHAGEWLGIVGPNGSGKSTLAHVTAGLLPLSRGGIRFHAHETSGPPRVGIVFQNPDAQIVGQTVTEDVSFGLQNVGVPASDIKGAVTRALTAVGLESFAHAEVRTLSGGQKQRLCVASVVAMNPIAIVFDETTSMLDPESRLQLLETVRRLNANGTTILWVTQRLEELAWVDRVVAMDDGGIAFNGSSRDFFYRTVEEGGGSACDALGFSPPFVVEVAKELMSVDASFTATPLTPDELAEAVARR